MSWLTSLVGRNPLMLSRWVLCWIVVGMVCGLFAGLYWNVLQWCTHGLRQFEGPSWLTDKSGGEGRSSPW